MTDRNSMPRESTVSQEEPIEKIILRSMNEGVITVECNGDIHTANPAALRILDLDEQNLKGQKFDSIFYEPENASFRGIFARVQAGLGTSHKEIQFKRNDGQTIDLAVATSFLEVDECQPGMQSVAIVFRDVTAFKSLERVKRRAVDHLSHELKTPLAIIKASAELLLKLNQCDPKSATNLERILRNLQRLSNMQVLVEEILNPPEYRPEALPITAYLEKILNGIRERSSHRSVAIVSRVENVQTATLDPAILRIVVETLVKNAIENSPDGAQITVLVQNILAGVLLQVRDRGVGIPVADQKFIFEGFHHIQATEEYSTRKPFDFDAGGMGLELLRLKVLSELGYFDISFESSRCKHIPTGRDHCPGAISSCPAVRDAEDCGESGGSTFSVLFRKGVNG